MIDLKRIINKDGMLAKAKMQKKETNKNPKGNVDRRLIIITYEKERGHEKQRR